MSRWKIPVLVAAIVFWSGGVAFSQTLSIWSGLSGFDPRNQVITVMQGLLAEGGSSLFLEVRKGQAKSVEEVVAAVSEGRVDLGVLPQSAFYQYGDVFKHDSQPWLVSDPLASRELDRVALPYMRRSLEDNLPGLMVLTSVTGHPLGLATNKKIKRLADLKGADLLLPRYFNASGFKALGLNPLKDERYRNDRATAPFLIGRKAKAVVVSLSRAQEFFERRGGSFIDLQMAFPKALLIANRHRLGGLKPASAKMFITVAALAAETVRQEQEAQVKRLKAEAVKRQITVIPFQPDFADNQSIMAKAATEASPRFPDPVTNVQTAVGGYTTGYCMKVGVPFGTNRRPETAKWPERGYLSVGQPDKQMVFGYRPDETLHFGTAVVSLPIRHLSGISKPAKPCSELAADPKTADLLSARTVAGDAFSKQLEESHAALLDRRSARVGREAAEKETLQDAFVFVHGYNNSFKDGMETAALLSHYLGDRIQPLAFSWPSAGSLWQYAEDGGRVEKADDHFQTFIGALAQSDAYGIYHLIAHSMGNRLVLPSTAKFDPVLKAKLGALLSVNSDLSLKRHEALDGEAVKRVRNANIYVASDDWTLNRSQNVNGERRAGQLDGDIFPYDSSFEPINITGRSTDLFSHRGHLGGLVERDMLQAMIGPQWTPLASRHLVREQVANDRVLWGFPFAP